ncbi:ATPase WRNIP1-like [Neocloeon triangulifer]|uniref:ATPase WRNIP1-like n=1 Tax=Neocloeon triangulifer TaxID=2078957 RepID=UPI00286F66F0|nr:ATPase WRNIP1-like [Neocloeon triangulifer]
MSSPAAAKGKRSADEALLADEVSCPICCRVFTVSEIEEHADRCAFLNSPSPSSSFSQPQQRINKRPSPAAAQAKGRTSADSQGPKKQKLSGDQLFENPDHVEPQNGTAEKQLLQTTTSKMDRSFSKEAEPEVSLNKSAPLAEQVRPKELSTFVGQEKVMGQHSMLRSLLREGEITSMILWGPPGCGKTTLANIVCQYCKQGRISARFVKMSAVASGVNDVKDVVKAAKSEMNICRKRTVLFMDEIHRFNKMQQDVFLPHVESGLIILIGATTENPSFSLNNALLSRCRVIVLEKLSSENVSTILKKALNSLGASVIPENQNFKEIQRAKLSIEEEALKFLAEICDGDARIALNSLQLAFQSKTHADVEENILVTLTDIEEGIKRSHMLYDRGGEEHYNIISAVHKSIRASDQNAAVYWTTRLIVSDEDPRYLARRLVRAAAEDIGMADPAALPLAVAAMQGCQLLGMPEADILLTECAVYLARAPKSREMQNCLDKAKECIANHKGPQPSVPLHLRNAPTRLMKDLGYGKGYSMIPSEVPDLKYMPEGLENVNFF